MRSSIGFRARRVCFDLKSSPLWPMTLMGTRARDVIDSRDRSFMETSFLDTDDPALNLGEAMDTRPTVLVIDDRAINREFLVSLLGYSGYRTMEAESPSGFSKLHPPDLIITDVQMPGVSGLDFLASLRADPDVAKIPVILYTGVFRTKSLEEEARMLGAFAVLSKPSEPGVLLNYVRSALATESPVSSSGCGASIRIH